MWLAVIGIIINKEWSKARGSLPTTDQFVTLIVQSCLGGWSIIFEAHNLKTKSRMRPAGSFLSVMTLRMHESGRSASIPDLKTLGEIRWIVVSDLKGNFRNIASLPFHQ
jgi:hypothetical protein